MAGRKSADSQMPETYRDKLKVVKPLAPERSKSELRMLFETSVACHGQTPLYQSQGLVDGSGGYLPDISKLSPFRKLNEQANAKLEAAWPALHERKEKQRGEAQKLEAERQMQTTAIPETVRDTVRAGGSPSWEAMHYMRMHPDDLAWLKAELGEELWEEFVAMINGRAKFWDRKVEK